MVRAIAIATQLPYRTVYDRLFQINRTRRKLRDRHSPRSGSPMASIREYLAGLGWQWTPTATIGSGTKVRLRAYELSPGRLIVRCSRHLTAVIDGVIHDTDDLSRDGDRAVYRYWRAADGDLPIDRLNP